MRRMKTVRKVKPILDHKAVNSLAVLKKDKKDYKQWDKRLRNARKGIWGEEIAALMTKIGGIPEKNANTDEKLRTEVQKIEEKNYDEAKLKEVRSGMWSIIVEKV